MTSTTVHQGSWKHSCTPGVTVRISSGGQFGPPEGARILVPPSPWAYPPGTVVECDCGKTWVSVGAPYVNTPGICSFRREGKIEWWRRERRARRD